LDNLEDLADERDRLQEEERRILSELGETRAKIAKLRPDLQSLRKNRDDLNETVKALKKAREELRDSSRRSLAKLRDSLKLSRGVDEGSRAEKMMADLEWEIQTSSLDKEAENRLLSRIRVLETKVGAHRKSRKLSDEIAKFMKEADEIHGKIQELAAQSQQYHLEVISMGEKFDVLRQKLEEQKKGLEDVRIKAAEVGQKFSVLKTATIQSEKISQREKAKAFKENLKELAKKKMSQSGKVSLEELGALMEDEEE
jgi:uncharacterized coiled-coil DUF342 family protein